MATKRGLRGAAARASVVRAVLCVRACVALRVYVRDILGRIQPVPVVHSCHPLPHLPIVASLRARRRRRQLKRGSWYSLPARSYNLCGMPASLACVRALCLCPRVLGRLGVLCVGIPGALWAFWCRYSPLTPTTRPTTCARAGCSSTLHSQAPSPKPSPKVAPKVKPRSGKSKKQPAPNKIYKSKGVISNEERIAVMMKVAQGELTMEEAEAEIIELEQDANAAEKKAKQEEKKAKAIARAAAKKEKAQKRKDEIAALKADPKRAKQLRGKAAAARDKIEKEREELQMLEDAEMEAIQREQDEGLAELHALRRAMRKGGGDESAVNGASGNGSSGGDAATPASPTAVPQTAETGESTTTNAAAAEAQPAKVDEPPAGPDELAAVEGSAEDMEKLAEMERAQQEADARAQEKLARARAAIEKKRMLLAEEERRIREMFLQDMGETFEVEIPRGETGSFGFGFGTDSSSEKYVSDVFEGGAAFGILELDDVIDEINGVACFDLDHRASVDMIKVMFRVA